MNKRFEDKVDEEGMTGAAEAENISVKGSVKSHESTAMTSPEKKLTTGQQLKSARESQGLSLEIVHESTKIPLDALRAIEEGYQVRMLSPFYYNGFVKMYANYLNVDVSEVLDDYKQEVLPEPIEDNHDEFEAPEWLNRLFTRRRKQQIVIVIGVLLVIFILFKIAGLFSSGQKKEQKTGKSAKIAEVKKEAKRMTAVARKEVPVETPNIVAPPAAPEIKPIIDAKVEARPIVSAPDPVRPQAVIPPLAAIQKNIVLTVRANQNSWLRVKTDGRTVFQSTLRVGAVETWLADEEIEISGRNINQLDFELNGKMIGTLGRKDHNAKSVVITKSGLSVKQ